MKLIGALKFFRLAAVLGVLGAAPVVLAGASPSGHWVDPQTGFAIGGFDPVAYFTQARPVMGAPAHEYVWGGVAWHFVNEGNLEAFRRDPEVYAPQFGGHGALAMAGGTANRGNPLVWEVYRDRLYLFFDVDARVLWRYARDRYAAGAQEHWRKMGGGAALADTSAGG